MVKKNIDNINEENFTESLEETEGKLIEFLIDGLKNNTSDHDLYQDFVEKIGHDNFVPDFWKNLLRRAKIQLRREEPIDRGKEFKRIMSKLEDIASNNLQAVRKLISVNDGRLMERDLNKVTKWLNNVFSSLHEREKLVGLHDEKANFKFNDKYIDELYSVYNANFLDNCNFNDLAEGELIDCVDLINQSVLYEQRYVLTTQDKFLGKLDNKKGTKLIAEKITESVQDDKIKVKLLVEDAEKSDVKIVTEEQEINKARTVIKEKIYKK